MKNVLLLLMLTFLPLFYGVSGISYAQTQEKKDLEHKKQKLQKEIEYQNSLLKEVKKNKNRSMIQLAILNNKISKQHELINTINKELNILEDNIKETKNNILQKEAELKELKDVYAQIIYASYKTRDSYTRIMFLFAANDFNQAIQRIKFMQYYSEARKKQATLITDAQNQLQIKEQELENTKNERSKTLNEKQTEKGKLSQQKKDKEETLTDLQAREKDIRAQIKKKKSQAEKLKKTIERVIAEEIAKAAKKAKNPSDIKKIVLTPEEKKLSNDFESNHGKLPWPLVAGVITEPFGKHQHPDLPGVEINNNGLNIGTNKGAKVRAIFKGVVVAVATVGGLDGKVIIIKHGEYLSVYSNIEESYVKSGDKVKTKEVIGEVRTDDNSGTVLHLEIWKGQTTLNPEDWILKSN